MMDQELSEKKVFYIKSVIVVLMMIAFLVLAIS